MANFGTKLWNGLEVVTHSGLYPLNAISRESVGIETKGPLPETGLHWSYKGVRTVTDCLYRFLKTVRHLDWCRCLCQVELRVREDSPARPVAENKWLKDTGMLPLGRAGSDDRLVGDGGCDSPAHFEGCHVYYIKVIFSFSVVVGVVAMLLLLLFHAVVSAINHANTKPPSQHGTLSSTVDRCTAHA